MEGTQGDWASERDRPRERERDREKVGRQMKVNVFEQVEEGGLGRRMKWSNLFSNTHTSNSKPPEPVLTLCDIIYTNAISNRCSPSEGWREMRPHNMKGVIWWPSTKVQSCGELWAVYLLFPPRQLHQNNHHSSRLVINNKTVGFHMGRWSSHRKQDPSGAMGFGSFGLKAQQSFFKCRPRFKV